MKFGLSSLTVSKINQVFARYPAIDTVLIYGSRAKGNYKTGSDIDLTLMGADLTYAMFIKISWELDDLLLPYTIDLSIFSKIDNADLVSHIQRVGQVFYSRIRY